MTSARALCESPRCAGHVWVVEVDEPKINASGQGADWWFAWLKADTRRPVSRIIPVRFASPMGVRVYVVMLTQELADWLADLALSQGCPKTAISVREIPRDLVPDLAAIEALYSETADA